MAKLSDKFDTKPIALAIEGIFVRNLPAKTVEEKFGDMDKRMKDDPEGLIVSLFHDLLCDEAGESFEDTTSYDAITSSLSMKTIHEIVNAIPDAIVPSTATAEK